jgi:GT2 family glycosyltransferase
MDIDVIIINYNRGDFTENCIRSILTYNPISPKFGVNFNYNIILIDNNSVDIETENLMKNINSICKEHSGCEGINYLKRINMFKSKKNLGCGVARNVGAKMGSSDIILFVDNDVEFRDNWGTGIMEGFSYHDEDLEEDGPGVGIVGLKTIDQNDLITGGGFNDPKNLTKMRGWKKDKHYLNSIDKVTFVSGAFFATYRDVFESVEGFNPQFFFWYEDSDYCLRVKKETGLNTIFNGKYPQIHYCQGSNKPEFIMDHLRISRNIMLKKWGVS